MTSFFYVVSYCHLSANLQTISIIVEKYMAQDNRAVVRIFIALFKAFFWPSLLFVGRNVKNGEVHPRTGHESLEKE